MRRHQIERHAGGQVGRHVRDVDPPAETVPFLPHGDRIVEVLRGFGVDREAELLTQVDAVGHIRLGCLVGLKLRANARVHKQPLEHDLDVLCLAELAFDACAPAAGANDDEVTGPDVAAPLSSIVTGTFGTKYGSPTNSLPRLSISTIGGRSVPLPVMLSSLWVASTKPEAALVRSQGWLPWQGRGWIWRSVIAGQRPACIAGGALNFEEAPDGEAGAGCAEQQSGSEQDQRIQRERDRVHVVTGLERAAV